MSVIFSLQHEEAGVNLNKERTVLFEIKAKAAWSTQPIFCGVLCRCIGPIQSAVSKTSAPIITKCLLRDIPPSSVPRCFSH